MEAQHHGFFQIAWRIRSQNSQIRRFCLGEDKQLDILLGKNLQKIITDVRDAKGPGITDQIVTIPLSFIHMQEDTERKIRKHD